MEDFKKGQAVQVLLDREHSLDGEAQEHAAKFLGYHIDRAWADVDLEEEHAGSALRSGDNAHKAKHLSIPIGAIRAAALLLFALLSLFNGGARAQFLGYTSSQSVSSTPFNNVTCTGSAQTANVPNLGQGAHYVIARAGAPAPTNFVLTIQGSNNSTSFTDISDQLVNLNANNPSGAINASGYYSVIRVSVTCNAGAAFSVDYSGISLTPSQAAGSQQYGQLMKSVGGSLPSNATFSLTNLRTPFGNSAGTMEFTYTGAAGPAGSTLTVTCASNSSFPSNRSFGPFTLNTPANSTQTIEVPPAACPFVNLTYTSGGASAALFNWDYAFYGQGVAPLTTPNIYKTASATAAGNTAVWTPAAQKRFVLQGVCVDVTGNATLAAAGVETIDLQDNTTSTGITFSVFINNAAGTGGTLFSQCIPSMGNGFVSSTPSNQLNVNLSTVLATGSVRVRAYGFEE